MKAHKYYLLWFALTVYFLAGTAIPVQQCRMPLSVNPDAVRYSAEHIANPIETAFKHVATLYIYPRCYAPVKELKHQYGWTYAITQVLKQKGMDNFKLWVNVICIFSALNTLFIAIGCFKTHRRNS